MMEHFCRFAQAIKQQIVRKHFNSSLGLVSSHCFFNAHSGFYQECLKEKGSQICFEGGVFLKEDTLS